MPSGPDSRSLRARLALPLGVLAATHLVGVLGYRWLWRDVHGTWMDALFMTFTTVATIGYGEVHRLDTAGRLFTMLVAVAGIGTLFFTFTVALDHLTSDAVRDARRRRRMQEQIDRVRGHVVLAGYGRVGREAARALRESGATVVVVDPAQEAADAAVRAGFLALAGDATDDTFLERLHLPRARGLVVTTANDATNLYVILSARLLNPALFVVARAVDEASVPKLVRAGANRAISPYAIGGRRLAHLMQSPHAVDFFETALQRGAQALRIADVAVGPVVAGRPLSALQAAAGGATVLAVVREQRVTAGPAPDFGLASDDRVLVLGTDAQIEALERATTGPAPG